MAHHVPTPDYSLDDAIDWLNSIGQADGPQAEEHSSDDESTDGETA